MTQLLHIPAVSSLVFGGGTATTKQGLFWGAIKPLGWDPAVDTVGYTLVPGLGVEFGESRAASPAIASYAIICTRAGGLTQIAARHRVAGAVATNISYTIWKDNGNIVGATATVAANSTTEVVTTFASQSVVVGTRLEIVAQVAAGITNGDMPEDVVVAVTLV